MKINNDPNAIFLQERQKAQSAELDAMKPRFDEILKKKDREALKKVSQEFEELFVGMVLKTMRQSVPKSDASRNSHELELYEGMLDEAYAKSISEKGAFGIADLIMKSFEPYLEQEDGKQKETSSFDLKG
ncbi:MAG: rod-binding protein [Bacillota bacterium]|nr:rod-binding protein [Bacillota bacterium]